MNYSKKILLLIIGISCVLISCSDNVSPEDENPLWVLEKINQFKSEPVGDPPQSIFRYKYNGEIVYYIPPQCCDQFSELYNYKGNLICAPDGGFTGQGDGKCPDFFEKRTDEILIWKDDRTR